MFALKSFDKKLKDRNYLLYFAVKLLFQDISWALLVFANEAVGKIQLTYIFANQAVGKLTLAKVNDLKVKELFSLNKQKQDCIFSIMIVLFYHDWNIEKAILICQPRVTVLERLSVYCII